MDDTAQTPAPLPPSAKPPMSENEKMTHVVYGLQALAIFLGVTSIAGVIINYIKRDEVKGTYLESHFAWQINTFWIALGASFVSFLLIFIIIGIFLLPLVGIWYIYRIVRGWVLLNEGKPIPNPGSLF